MLDRITGRSIHENIQFIALLAIAIGMPWSKIPMSLGTILLALNILLKADFKSYKNIRIHKNSPFLFFLLFLGLEWLSLFWTTDWDYATHDLRVKLPLYVIPISILLLPISARKIQLILVGFITAVIIIVCINLSYFYHFIGNKTYADIRNLSLFGSHIRFGLMIVMSIAILCFQSKNWKIPLYITLPILSLLLFYIFISQVLSAYLALFLLFIVLGIKYVQNKPFNQKIIYGGVFILSITSVAAYTLYWVIPPAHKIEVNKLKTISPDGNPYFIDKKHLVWENGYPIQANVDQKVLEEEWNNVSSIDYASGKDKTNIPIYWTIWRYMSSKGLTKDRIGFRQLTSTDIQNIENGIPSIIPLKSAFHKRLYGIQEELAFNSNPNGHSLLQRLSYWKAALEMIKSDPIFGKGAGDVKKEFEAYYNSNYTRLDKKYQLRAHNQFLTICISSGLLSLCCFLLWWIYSISAAINTKNWTATTFCLIALSSFLTEDTIETQMGVTFIAFFFGVLVLNQCKLSPTSLAH